MQNANVEDTHKLYRQCLEFTQQQQNGNTPLSSMMDALKQQCKPAVTVQCKLCDDDTPYRALFRKVGECCNF